MKLKKIWSSNLKNRVFGGLFPVIDPFNTDWFYIGDGWDSFYPSMKLRKFSFSSGQEIQSVYIKNNVRCLYFEINEIDLFVVTNDKIIQLDRKSLDVVNKFERGIQKYNDYAGSNNRDTLLMMNYRKEFLFTYNYKTKKGRKKKIGSCCGIFKKSDDEFYLFNGSEGKILVYDILDNSVTEFIRTDVFHSVQLENNIAFLRLGYVEYDTNSWQIKPTSNIRMIDLTKVGSHDDLETGINFQWFKATSQILYLWKQNELWSFSVADKKIIHNESTDRNEYIIGVFSDEGKILTETDTRDGNKALYCYELKI